MILFVFLLQEFLLPRKLRETRLYVESTVVWCSADTAGEGRENPGGAGGGRGRKFVGRRLG